MSTCRLTDCVARAINFLDKSQLYNGEFTSYWAKSETLDDTSASVESCTFVTSCILYCLRFLDDPGAAAMKQAAYRFLISEMIYPGLWTYFSSTSPTQSNPDLDSTACASFLLKEIHPDIGVERNLDIILANRNESGLFFTWLGKAEGPNDIDSVVNANVLLYLGEREETRAASDYLIATVADRKEAETYYYYLDNLALYYAVSRAYFNGVTSLGEARDRIVSNIGANRRDDGSFGNELLTALALCSLLNYGCGDLEVLGGGVENLVSAQLDDGSWPRIAYYAGPVPPKPLARWYGSEELTTALCLEALVRYRALVSRK